MEAITGSDETVIGEVTSAAFDADDEQPTPDKLESDTEI